MHGTVWYDIVRYGTVFKWNVEDWQACKQNKVMEYTYITSDFMQLYETVFEDIEWCKQMRTCMKMYVIAHITTSEKEKQW